MFLARNQSDNCDSIIWILTCSKNTLEDIPHCWVGFFHLNIDRLMMNNSNSPVPTWLTYAKTLACHACLPTTAPALVQSCELHQILPSIITGHPVTLKHISAVGRRPHHFWNPLKSPNPGKNVLERNTKRWRDFHFHCKKFWVRALDLYLREWKIPPSQCPQQLTLLGFQLCHWSQ